MDETVELCSQNHVGDENPEDQCEYQALKRILERLGTSGKNNAVAFGKNLFRDLRDFFHPDFHAEPLRLRRHEFDELRAADASLRTHRTSW